MYQIELPELKNLIYKNVGCKNKVEHLIVQSTKASFNWVESNRSYDVIQINGTNILVSSNKNIENIEFEYVIRSNINLNRG
ncbi:hypothetical protein HXZ65_03795 [Acinetobacter indicus]|uniref:hypothetical protein n=1 Tax=Acinetobacter indicus TaxID=756892 RepID=UPI002575A30C|nr:hypothetical protein [Acinetobacter indicus]MDM1277381.1 hypothetical protein [Acinetobacter indicus]